MVTDALVPRVAEGAPEVGIPCEGHHLRRAVLDRVREERVVRCRDLHRDAADGTGDHRLPLPQRFGNDQAEPFLE